MGQLGNLSNFFGANIRAAHVSIPSVSASQAAPFVSSLYLFRSLEQLTLTFESSRTRLGQQLLCAVSELRRLTHLRIVGGTLDLRFLNLEVRL